MFFRVEEYISGDVNDMVVKEGYLELSVVKL